MKTVKMVKTMYKITILFTIILIGALFLRSRYNKHNLERHCVAYYKMNDNADSNEVIDTKDYSNGISHQNTSQMHTTGKINGAFTFNGTSDYIDTNNTYESVFQNDFSISLWCKPDDGIISNSDFMIGLAKKLGLGWSDIVEIFHDLGKVGFYYYANSSHVTFGFDRPVVFSDGQESWHHIVIIVEQIGTNAKATSYFDGSYSYSETSIGNVIMADYNSGPNLFIGASNDENLGIIGNFAGVIDNVIIFNKALNSNEIRYLYNNGRGREDFNYSSRRN